MPPGTAAKALLLFLFTLCTLTVHAQAPNHELYADDPGPFAPAGFPSGKILNVLPPADTLEKVKCDSLVYLGKYFVCFKTDKAYQDLVSDPLLHESIGSVSLSSRIELPSDPVGYINDFERVLDEHQIAELDSIVREYERRTSNEIVVVTIDSSWVPEQSFDSLIRAFHRSWSVGKKDKGNGLVMGISVSHKKIKISTGRGIEHRIPDKDVKHLIDKVIIPEFRHKKYYSGTLKGLLAIMERL